jgi:hypothetical protein
VGSNPTPAAKLDGDDVDCAGITRYAFSVEREHSMPLTNALATIIRISSRDVAGYAPARVELEGAA